MDDSGLTNPTAGCNVTCGPFQEVQPYKASSTTWSLTGTDHAIVNALREARSKMQRPPADTPESMMRLRDVVPGRHFSCHCKVRDLLRLLCSGNRHFSVKD